MKIKVKRFEELTTSELYEILRCRAEVFIVGQHCNYQDIDGADKASTHIYFEEDGSILAYLRVIDPGVKFPAASIGRVLTMNEFRSHGLARKLMLEGISVAQKLSDTIEIEAQSYLVDFYRSLGFRETSEEYLIDGLPHISMVLNISK